MALEHLPADILPFPPPNSATHLRLALRNLMAALEEQRAAVVEFRHALQDLKAAVGGLAGSLSAYQTGVAGLALQVGQLRDQTKPALRF